VAVALALGSGAALPAGALAKRAPVRLRAFASCPQLVDYARGHFAQRRERRRRHAAGRARPARARRRLISK
jgi:hypothetical protein